MTGPELTHPAGVADCRRLRGEQQAPPLWPHQQRAVTAAVAHLAGGGRALGVAACGMGKTRIASETAAHLAGGGRTLVVVPTLELLAQTLAGWVQHRGAGVGRITAVCSDATATAPAASLLAETGRLEGVTTDPQQLAALLAGEGPLTALATYASLDVVAAAHQECGAPSWDLAVIDEAHRSAGSAAKAWSIIHHDAHIPARRRLYLTATPRILTSSRSVAVPLARGRRGDEAEGEQGLDVLSMDDERVFGPPVFTISFAEGIAAGILADYRVVVATVSDRDVQALITTENARTAAEVRMIAAQIAVLKAAARYGLRRIVTYHHRIAGARRFAATLPGIARLLEEDEQPTAFEAHAVDGQMLLARRRAVLDRLTAPGESTVIISNAKVLTEGVDVPALDAVMFTDPRASLIDVIQGIGRALRRGPHPGKVATIIVPVVVPDGHDVEDVVHRSGFSTLWHVVRALRAHDERLGAWLDQQRITLATSSSAPAHNASAAPSAALQDKPPAWLKVLGADADLARALAVRAVATTTSSWFNGYARARAFHAACGHLDIPLRHVTSDGFHLGKWLTVQRSRHRQGLLPTDHAALLEQLGVNWGNAAVEWAEHYAHAVEYYRLHKHLVVPTDYVCSHGFALGLWLSGQRKYRKRGTLPPERSARLDALGMVWDLRAHKWERACKVAAAFAARNGGLTRVPPTYSRDGVNLGTWLSAQRDSYQRGILSKERIAALERLGIEWDTSDRYWNRGLQAARAFHAAHGHLNAPAPCVIDSVDLAAWLNARRFDRRSAALNPRRIAALDALGMRWDGHGADWDDGLADLTDYHRAHGHLNVRHDQPGKRIPDLLGWLQRRRYDHQRSTLPDEHAQALNALGIRWDFTLGPHAGALAALEDFHRLHGHLHLPPSHTVDGLNVSAWLHRQRHDHRKGDINPELLARLNQLDPAWHHPARPMRRTAPRKEKSSS